MLRNVGVGDKISAKILLEIASGKSGLMVRALSRLGWPRRSGQVPQGIDRAGWGSKLSGGDRQAPSRIGQASAIAWIEQDIGRPNQASAKRVPPTPGRNRWRLLQIAEVRAMHGALISAAV